MDVPRQPQAVGTEQRAGQEVSDQRRLAQASEPVGRGERGHEHEHEGREEAGRFQAATTLNGYETDTRPGAVRSLLW